LAVATALFTVWVVLAGSVASAEEKGKDRPKKIYAHYMGCYPAACMATWSARNFEAQKIRHDGKRPEDAFGGRWRNYPLAPDGTNLPLAESADLEIRRALRGGIDGFFIDAWAGNEGAKNVMDALFAAAEAKDYPFEISICLDTSCLGGKPGAERIEVAADAIRYVLDKHGKSPKLARRDGKPLIAGYNSVFLGLSVSGTGPAVNTQAFDTVVKQTPGWRGNHNLWTDRAFRMNPTVWDAYGRAYRAIEDRVGQPIYFHFCMCAFFCGVNDGHFTAHDFAAAAGAMAANLPAVGEFICESGHEDRMAAAVKAKGAEWCEPMYFQYENIGWGGNRISMGFDTLRERWQHARDNGSTLIQFVTWNDYTENTCLAPAYETRYAVLDLNSYFIKWWKTGHEPVPDHDRVYLSYRKYPKGAKIFPFKPKQPDAGGVLEVLTILPKPARIRLPGRDAEYYAPAGMFWRQFDLKPGPVIAEVVRDGKVDVRLESPEPITDRPYREQNGMTCYSTEFLRHWKADFGDAKPLLRGEYADDDHNGLPNWFEMYWYGKFFDWSTATGTNPRAIAKDGKTNLQHYLDQTAPVDLPAIKK
jgi:hypothetical protein